jgi:hypothetical protein
MIKEKENVVMSLKATKVYKLSIKTTTYKIIGYNSLVESLIWCGGFGVVVYKNTLLTNKLRLDK